MISGHLPVDFWHSLYLPCDHHLGCQDPELQHLGSQLAEVLRLSFVVAAVSGYLPAVNVRLPE